jgi:hypothetical protein
MLTFLAILTMAMITTLVLVMARGDAPPVRVEKRSVRTRSTRQSSW